MASNNTLNFQASAIDTSLNNSLAQLASGFNQAGIGQANFVNTSIQQDREAQYKKDKLASDEAYQNSVLGQGAAKIAQADYQLNKEQQWKEAKNRAAFEAGVQNGYIPKGTVYNLNTDFSTLNDTTSKALIDKSTIAQHNASINNLNASTTQTKLITDTANAQLNQQKQLDKWAIYNTTERPVVKTNTEWTNAQNTVNNTPLVNPLEGVQQFDPNHIPTLTELANKEKQLNNVRINTGTTNPENMNYSDYEIYGVVNVPTKEEQQLAAEVNSLRSKVSPEVLKTVYPSIANGSYDKYIADKALVDKANTYLTNPANEKVTNYEAPTVLQTIEKMKTDGVDASTINAYAKTYLNGTNNATSLSNLVSGTNNSNPLSSKINTLTGKDNNKDTRDQIYLQEHTKKALSEKEQYAVNYAKYSKALTQAGVNVDALTQNDSLEKAVKEYLTPEGLPKNSIEAKTANIITSLQEMRSKDETDKDTGTNLNDWVKANQEAFKDMNADEIKSLMQLVKSKYQSQSTSWWHNIFNGSPTGDALVNATNDYNDTRYKDSKALAYNTW